MKKSPKKEKKVEKLTGRTSGELRDNGFYPLKPWLVSWKKRAILRMFCEHQVVAAQYFQLFGNVKFLQLKMGGYFTHWHRAVVEQPADDVVTITMFICSQG